MIIINNQEKDLTSFDNLIEEMLLFLKKISQQDFFKDYHRYRPPSAGPFSLGLMASSRVDTLLFTIKSKLGCRMKNSE